MLHSPTPRASCFCAKICFCNFHSDCFARLRVLALNSCGVASWAAVQLLSPHLPAVEELYLAGNSLPDLPRLKAEKEYQDATGAEESVLQTGQS